MVLLENVKLCGLTPCVNLSVEMLTPSDEVSYLFEKWCRTGRSARDGSAVSPGMFRDFEQVTAHAPVAANRRQGTLAVYLDDPPPRQPPAGQPSPWEGMSGGPVLAGGRIVGVVAEHHPSEGTGRLTARRIDRAYETAA